MKNVLFLTRSYPDTSKSATALCTHRVMECVRDTNRYDVHVLCYRTKGELFEESIKGVLVHRIKRSLWSRVVGKLSSSGFKKIALVAVSLQKIFTSPWYPNISPISTRLLFQRASNLQNKYGYDIVVSEYHDEDTLICGCKLEKKYGVMHMALLWDPIEGQMAVHYLPKYYTEKCIHRLEKYAVKNSTLLISTGMMNDYYKEYGDLAPNKRMYLGIPGILPPDDEVQTQYTDLLKDGSINIVFSGLLSPTDRDPRPIINLLNCCQFAESINLVFFSMGAFKEISCLVTQFKGSIVNHGYISLRELHSVYRHADYLLNISHVNAKMVPSKIFEYMSYGKPIISTYKTDGDAAQNYLERYPESLCIDLKRDTDINIEMINNFLSKKHIRLAFNDIKSEFKDNTPEAYLEIIDKLITK